MHPYANPLVIAWWVRHPHSVAIEDDTYYGDSSELSERGQRQLHRVAKEIRRLRPDLILCSPAVRTMKVILETADLHIGDILKQEPAVGEWPRATHMLGKPNSDQEVQDYLENRVRRFGPRRKTLPGEESFEHTQELMGDISQKLIFQGTLIRKERKRAARIVILSHGNRGRQFLAYAMANADRKLFKEYFRLYYNKAGLEPTGIMGPLWYGRFFRSSHLGWNIDLGNTSHLPRKLRDSEI